MFIHDWESEMLLTLTRKYAKAGFNFEDGYVTDLIHDIQSMEKMSAQDTAYILVRPLGTSWCWDQAAVRRLNTPDVVGKAIALTHIKRTAWSEFKLTDLDPRDFVQVAS